MYKHIYNRTIIYRSGNVILRRSNSITDVKPI